jgi:YVTN family beta-propeller protein
MKWGAFLALLAVQAAGGAAATAQGTDSSGAQATRTEKPGAIRTVPGMPPVVDPANLYSETAAGKVRPDVANALPRVYVPNRRSNDVYVIDANTLQVIDSFKVGINPQHVVPSWDLKRLWVTNNAERRGTGTLTPIDPMTGKPGQAVDVDNPYNMYFTPDGRSAVVVAEARMRLDFRDPHTMALQSALPVPGCAGINHGDFSIDGRFAIFTCEFKKGTLAKIDFAERKVLGYLQLSKRGMPQDIRISPDGKVFFVADMHSGGVFVIDGERFTELTFIETGTGAHGLYPSRDAKAPVRREPRLAPRLQPPGRQGQRLGHRLRHAQGGRELADPGRRQPGHGQRQRRRQDALALGSIRRRGLRDRHDERRGEEDQGRAPSRTA